ncbi:inversin isoform X2 [Acipenser ruthenus]|uniref:inversin isoform X2 n=1 Tax=Acipenser ruthenus TaxID=7906 RepID=UPI00274068E6|nr:inversin isoform X2 [Acipenser ruthenus]
MASTATAMAVPERNVPAIMAALPSSSSLASQVHAAAVNGDRTALNKLIAGTPALRDAEDQFGRTPLMYCVLADRLDCAESLLKAGANVNKADHSQRTALHLAAQKGNYRFMKLLLARRANWMQKDLEEMTPLHLATRHKNPKCLALLLKHMAPGEVDTQDKNKQTSLHWSAYYNNPEHVKLLIKHDSNIGIPDVEGKIPLHWAANNKDPSAVHTVHCILEAAPTESLLNWQDYEGRTPLHFAVADGNEAVVDVLTSYEGCNVTSYDNLFRTPLHWAALLGHAQIVHLLLERNKPGTIPSDSQGATPLHYAAQSNFAETVRVFLQHPSVKDDPDLEGRTAFMWAAGKGSDEVIRTMLHLKSDIDINMADKYGGTALHAAALSGHMSTVSLLLEHGAQVDSMDVMKHTPLFRACEMGHRDVIQTLIKGKARVDLVDQDGHSPLHWAALGGNADVCQTLIENGINPNMQDLAGRTPLQCAAYGGYINCMAVLMENKADPNIQDKEGRTALHWSCNNGYLDAVKLLLGYSAFPNQMENNEERYTPLDYALLGEHHEVIHFMLEHGALSIAAIQDIAASKIQAVYKGYKVRKAFQERKNLLMKHEQLRKDAAKKREEENKRKEAELQRGKLKRADRKPRILQLSENERARAAAGQSTHPLSKKPSPAKPEPGPPRAAQKQERGRRSAKSQDQEAKERSTVQQDASTPVELVSRDTPETGPTRMPSSSSGVFRKTATPPVEPARPASKGLNGGRHSPAGSSRPGSAKPALTVNGRASGVTSRAANTTPDRVQLTPLTLRSPKPQSPATASQETPGSEHILPQDSLASQSWPRTQAVMSAEQQHHPRQHSRAPWQDSSIELVPLEVRLQVVEKERIRKELFRKKNKAAAVIQRAWRSFQLRRELTVLLGRSERGVEQGTWEKDAAAFLVRLLWEKPLHCSSLLSPSSTRNTKPPTRAMSARTSRHSTSVLKSIYGSSQSRQSKLVRNTTLSSRNPSQLLFDLSSLSSETHLGGMQYVHLLENIGKSTQFSYHMRPCTSAKSSKSKLKE